MFRATSTDTFKRKKVFLEPLKELEKRCRLKISTKLRRK